MAAAMLWVNWKISPMAGGAQAPPMIDMMMMEPPNFVFGPNPLMPSAKMVGNMSDMKKLVMNTAPTPSQPGNKTPMPTSAVLMMP